MKIKVDKAVCLMLDKRLSYWDELRNSFSAHGIELQLFLAGDGESSDLPYNHIDIDSLPPVLPQSTRYPTWRRRPNAYNAHLCHKKIIEQAQEENVQSLLIVEDDVFIEDDFDEIIERAEEWLLHNNWDMLYFGCFQNGQSRELYPYVRQLFGVGGWHCVLIKNHMFDELLKYGPIGPFDDTCGRFIQQSGSFTSVGIYPCVVSQKSGYSYVEDGHLDKPSRYKI